MGRLRCSQGNFQLVAGGVSAHLETLVLLLSRSQGQWPGWAKLHVSRSGARAVCVCVCECECVCVSVHGVRILTFPFS